MKTVLVFLFVAAVAKASVIGGHWGGVGTVLAGPAGAVISHGAPGHGIVGIGGIGAIGGVGLVGPGSGLEGQWVPDINEHLHDDGSWKPWLDGSLAGHGHGW